MKPPISASEFAPASTASVNPQLPPKRVSERWPPTYTSNGLQPTRDGLQSAGLPPRGRKDVQASAPCFPPWCRSSLILSARRRSPHHCSHDKWRPRWAPPRCRRAAQAERGQAGFSSGFSTTVTCELMHIQETMKLLNKHNITIKVCLKTDPWLEVSQTSTSKSFDTGNWSFSEGEGTHGGPAHSGAESVVFRCGVEDDVSRQKKEQLFFTKAAKKRPNRSFWLHPRPEQVGWIYWRTSALSARTALPKAKAIIVILGILALSCLCLFGYSFLTFQWCFRFFSPVAQNKPIQDSSAGPSGRPVSTHHRPPRLRGRLARGRWAPPLAWFEFRRRDHSTCSS